MIVVNKPPIQAARGTQACNTPKLNIATATKPAPAEIPRRNGSAKPLRNIPCNNAPAVPKAAPTSIAAKVLGSRKSHRIVW